jgi:chromosome segregation ATPase
LQSRLKKLQELSSTDKDIIDALQKKLTTQRIDMESL